MSFSRRVLLSRLNSSFAFFSRSRIKSVEACVLVGLCSMSAPARLQRRYDIGQRVNDALDLRRQRFECVRHFFLEFVLIINGAHAAELVTETALADVGRNSAPAQ